jgi:hypothetical protein
MIRIKIKYSTRSIIKYRCRTTRFPIKHRQNIIVGYRYTSTGNPNESKRGTKDCGLYNVHYP